MSQRILLVGLLVSTTMFSQVSSRVGGAITDNSDAVILGVKVTIEDVDRGTTLSTSTNEAGRYLFPNLVVGNYRVTAEFAGFRKSSTRPFKVDVNVSLDVNLKLEVGQVTESVEVTGAASLVQTSDSQVGNLIDSKKIVELPLAARDFMQLSVMATGVAESNGNKRHQTERATWQGSFSVHGHDPTYNQYLFDGVAGKEAAHQTNVFSPSIDSIQEIKIETANYSAEFGSEAGGHVNVVTRAGTNQFHGVLFEFLRNDRLDARDSFADRKSKLRRNTFGGTIGGPIQRDKTFFFASWESMRLRQGFTQNTTVPTPAFRDGNFAALLGTDNSSRTPIAIYDWTAGTPFAGNVVPKTRMHALPVRFMNEFVPLPNRPGIGGILPNANYQSLAPQETGTNQFIGRLDRHINANDRVYGRYAISDTGTIGPPVWPAFGYAHNLRGQHTVFNWSHTLSPSMINEFRAGYSRFVQNELVESAFKRDVSEELGLKGSCRSPACWHAPYFSVQDFSLFGNPSGQTLGQGVSGPRGWKDEIFQIHESLLIVRGNHSLRAGFTGNRYRDTFPEAIRPAGQHSFNGQWTAGAGSRGFALADMLMGLPRGILASIDIFDPNFRNSQAMPWIQDDWKITRKLTLNLGLRYEWFGRMVANRDKISNVFFSGPGAARIITPADNTPGLGRSLLHNDNNNFAPRFGFAYALASKMAVRGAYGVFSQRYSAQDAIGLSINPPFIRTGDVTLGVNANDLRAFPIDDLTPVVNFLNPASRPAMLAIDVNAGDGLVQQWNFFVERGLGQNMVLKAGYVGTKSNGLDIFRNPNTPKPGPGDVQSRRPYNNISTIRLSKSELFANYHGLEMSAEHRFAHGINFTTGYTWSRTIDNNGTLDPYNTSLDKALSNFHLAHRAFSSAVWEVPFGRGRRFGGSSHGVVDAIAGGWQVSTFLVLATGNPLTITTLGDILNTGGGYTQVPIRTGQVNYNAGDRTRSKFFNTDVFTRPAQYQLGNAGRNILIGPGSRNIDLSVNKEFRVAEKKSVQFRAEFYNSTNHPNWGNPGTTLGTASFGVITSNSNLPRDIQLGLKFRY